MVVRAALLFVAVIFLCVAVAFLGICLYQALLHALLAPWLAALLTGIAGLVVAGVLAFIGTYRRRQPAAPSMMASLPFAATATLQRAVEQHPIAAITAAAALGLVQSLIFGRRR